MKIGFVGLSHLGIISSVVCAHKGNNVIAYDENSEIIENLKKSNSDFDEPNLKTDLKKNKKNIFFTSNFKDLSQCKLVFISKDIKTDKNNNSQFKEIKKLINKSLQFLNRKTILIILSQVNPGFTRKINWPKSNLYYQVETLIFGEAIKRAKKPERFIIGSNNPKRKINSNYKKYLKSFKCPLFNVKYESAELSKISINIMLASSITATNTLAEICENVNADWSEIKDTLKLDKRIGKYSYINPGLGISGGNIERDLKTVTKISQIKKIKSKYINSIIHSSAQRKNWTFHLFNNEILKKIKKPKICILGLSYKENTNSLKNSPSIELIKKINDLKINTYDPAAIFKHRNVKHFHNANEALKDTDILFIMTPWKEFKNIREKDLLNLMRQKFVVDPFRLLENKITSKKIKYYTIGKGK